MTNSNKKTILEKWDDGTPKTEKIESGDGTMIKVSYYKNGQIHTKESIVSDLRTGQYQRFWKNGMKWDETNFLDGKEHGETVLYNEDGKVWLRGEYRYGKKIGRWTFHNSDGEVSRTENFDE